jgi:diguanylate cyclase (GGDEF)-like protein
MLSQLALMGAESIIVSVLLLFLYWLRPIIGLAGLYIAVGAFQYMQVLLALSIYVEILPGFLVSPGSAVVFSASLFAILLVYLEEDAVGARNLIYGLVVANLSLSLLAMLFGLHLDNPSTRNFFDLPRELFIQSPRIWIVGTLVLIADTVFLILIFEAISRFVTGILFQRIFLSMVVVLTFDTVFFVTGSFFERPDYGLILVSGIAGKAMMAFFYSMTLTAYLTWFRKTRTDHLFLPLGDIFALLTYRQRYEDLREQALTDSLTGVYNRNHFESCFEREVEKARTAKQRLSLILLDLDHFKQINDKYGHQEGDRALSETGAILIKCLRASDLAFRYGGEEFVLIMPGMDKARARALAARILDEIRNGLTRSQNGGHPSAITATLGVATFPDEATTATELIDLADKRLYAGKSAGRNRVVEA